MLALTALVPELFLSPYAAVNRRQVSVRYELPPVIQSTNGSPFANRKQNKIISVHAKHVDEICSKTNQRSRAGSKKICLRKNKP